MKGIPSGMSEQKMPPQHQERQPGIENRMQPKPRYVHPDHRPSGMLDGRTVLITGGDSGIGRAAAVGAAIEGAAVAFAYLNEHEDAQVTKGLVEQAGGRRRVFAGDIGDPAFCRKLVEDTVAEFGGLDGVFNNAGEQHREEDFQQLKLDNLEKTFRTNIFAQFYVSQAALPHLEKRG